MGDNLLKNSKSLAWKKIVEKIKLEDSKVRSPKISVIEKIKIRIKKLIKAGRSPAKG